jgi:hypothetical protein
MRAISLLPVLALLAGGSPASAQPTAQQQVEINTPSWTKRAPDMGDASANPSTYEQINRLKDGLDAQGLPRDKAAAKGGTRPANAAEIAIGSQVRDKRGKPVGAVEGVEADGAVVVTAAGKVKVPLEAFGKDDKGLVIGITKAEFDKLVASATAAPAG